MNRRGWADYCEAQVRRFDRDHWLTALFAAEEVRPHLFALYAFEVEIARVAHLVSEPMLGEMRLQWWRETLESLRQGAVRDHPVAQGLADALTRYDGFGLDALDALVDAHGPDLYPVRIASMAELEDQVAATHAPVIGSAARLLGAGADIEPLSRAAALAVGLAAVLRRLPGDITRDRIYLPGDLMDQEGVQVASLHSGQASAALRPIVRAVATAAWAQAREARRLWRTMDVPAALPAFLPVALVGLYLKPIARRNLDPLKGHVEVPVYRRQLRLLRAAFTGRL